MLHFCTIGWGIFEFQPRQSDTTVAWSPLMGSNTPLDVEDVHWKRSPLDSEDHTGVLAGVTGIVLIKVIPEFLH